MRIITAEQQRTIEKKAVALSVSTASMMENAGFMAADLIKKRFDVASKPVAVLCGAGGNGGDGFAFARKLSSLGAKPVIVLCAGTPKAGDSAEMYSKAVASAVPVIDGRTEQDKLAFLLENCVLIVDAVFGTGFTGRELPKEIAAVISLANSKRKPRVSLDVPSGIAADSGEHTQMYFCPDMTLCFVAKKMAHVLKRSRELCGAVELVDIGIPETAFSISPAPMQELDAQFVNRMLPPKSPLSNKSSFGRLLCAVGSSCYRGAAVLCAKGAVRSGAGIVEVASCESAVAAVAAALPEPILYDIFSDRVEAFMQHISKATALVVGCGLADNEDSAKLFDLIMLSSKAPVVVDATGIKFASSSIDLISGAARQVVITPHFGEFSALTGIPVLELSSNPVAAAVTFARSHGCTVVLKGPNTVVASPSGETFFNTNGNPGLAKGGSGDLLAGMIGAFLAMGIRPAYAAAIGVYLHGAAADIACSSDNEYSVTPSDIADCIGLAIRAMRKAQ